MPPASGHRAPSRTSDDPQTPRCRGICRCPKRLRPRSLLGGHRDRLPRANGDFLVVAHEGHLVAMGGIRPNTPQQADVLHIRVHPAICRQGVGRQLMSALQGRAAELGFQELHLETATSQPEAAAFYDGLGYIRLREETRPEWAWTLVFFAKQL